MIIRRAEAADGAALATLFHCAIRKGAAAAYTPKQLRAWAGPGPRPESWATRTQDIEIWIAWVEGQPVGFAGRDGDVFDLLFVHPDQSGRGVAKALHVHVISAARAAGVTHMTTYASHVARPVFAALGWQVVRPNQVVRDGVTLENWLMRRDI